MMDKMTCSTRPPTCEAMRGSVGGDDARDSVEVARLACE